MPGILPLFIFLGLQFLLSISCHHKHTHTSQVHWHSAIQGLSHNSQDYVDCSSFNLPSIFCSTTTSNYFSVSSSPFSSQLVQQSVYKQILRGTQDTLDWKCNRTLGWVPWPTKKKKHIPKWMTMIWSLRKTTTKKVNNKKTVGTVQNLVTRKQFLKMSWRRQGGDGEQGKKFTYKQEKKNLFKISNMPFSSLAEI